MIVTKTVNSFEDCPLRESAWETLSRLTRTERKILFSATDEDCAGSITIDELNDFLTYDTETISEWIGRQVY